MGEYVSMGKCASQRKLVRGFSSGCNKDYTEQLKLLPYLWAHFPGKCTSTSKTLVSLEVLWVEVRFFSIFVRSLSPNMKSRSSSSAGQHRMKYFFRPTPHSMNQRIPSLHHDKTSLSAENEQLNDTYVPTSHEHQAMGNFGL